MPEGKFTIQTSLVSCVNETVHIILRKAINKEDNFSLLMLMELCMDANNTCFIDHLMENDSG